MVRAERNGTLLQLTLNRPEHFNAINLEMSRELRAHLEAAAADPELSLLVIRGEGNRTFCGGADVPEMTGGNRPLAQEILGNLEAILLQIVTLPVPAIAVVNGHALGAGAYLAAACDLRVGRTTAKFQFGAVNYGLVLGSWFLPDVLGPSLTRDILLTARHVAGDEAVQLGLLHRAFPAESFAADVDAFVGLVGANHAGALRLCKTLLADRIAAQAAVRDREIAHNLQNAGSEDFRFRLTAAVAAGGRPPARA